MVYVIQVCWQLVSRIRKELYTQQWYISHRFPDSFRAGSGRNCTHSNGIFHTGLLTVCEQYQEGTVHTAMVYVTQVCWQLASRIRKQLYTQQWYMSYRFADSLRAWSGRNCTHSNGVCHTGLLTACEQDQEGSVHTAMVYVIQVCWQLASRIRKDLYTQQWYMSYRFADSLLKFLGVGLRAF